MAIVVLNTRQIITTKSPLTEEEQEHIAEMLRKANTKEDMEVLHLEIESYLLRQDHIIVGETEVQNSVMFVNVSEATQEFFEALEKFIKHSH